MTRIANATLPQKKGNRVDFRSIEVIPAFPSSMHPPEGGEEIFERLSGARIIRIGAAASGEFEGGGLILDYSLPGSNAEHRLVFSFNELGMWLAAETVGQFGDVRRFSESLSEGEIRSLSKS